MRHSFFCNNGPTVIAAMPALVIFMVIVILGGLLGILWLAEWIAEHIWGDDL